MLDRMTPHDDARGLQRGLNGNLATPGKLRLLLERRSQVVNYTERERGEAESTEIDQEAEGRSTAGDGSTTAGNGEYGYTVEFPSQLSHLVQQSLLHQPYISYAEPQQQDLPEPVQLMYVNH
eukprot:sb/3475973/